MSVQRPPFSPKAAILMFTTRLIEIPTKDGKRGTLQTTVYELLIESARARMSPFEASHHAGVSPVIVNRWLEKGETDLLDYQEGYLDELTREGQFAMDWHMADGRMAFLTNRAILKCALEGNWMAGMTMNERRNPRDYGKKSTVALEGETTTRILIEEVTGADWQTGGRAIREDVVDSHLLSAGEEK